MKRLNKILLLVLAAAMTVPMLATLMPLTADAAGTTAHVVYQNKFDFEDAAVGEKLTEDYLNGKVDSRFTATVQSGVDTNSSGQRNPSSYTVVSEAVDDGTNKYIQPNIQAAMPTLYDKTGITWQQPYELRFKIKGEKGSYLATGATSDSGYKYGALIAVSTTITATPTSSRQSLLYAKDLTINWGSNGSNNICTLVSNQWHEITAQINPLTGVIKLRIEQLTFDEAGTKMTKGTQGTVNSDGTIITSKTAVSAMATAAAAGPTEGLVSIGRFYGDAAVDFCFDDIFLGSYIDEYIDFTDAVIHEIPGTTEVQTLTAYLSENGGGMTTGVTQFTDAKNTDCYDLVQVGDEWYLNQDIATTAKANATAAGVTFKDTTNLSGDETVEIVFDFHKNSEGLSNAYNVVRFSGGSTVAPLTFRQGKYITTNAMGYAILRKTESGYQQGLLEQNTWYSFKTVVDLSTGKFHVYMNEGRITDADGAPIWEELYFFKNGTVDGKSGGTLVEGVNIVNNIYDSTEYADIMTTEGDLAWYNGSVSFTNPTLYLMHGTNDAWASRDVNAYMDNLSIKTTDGNINVSMDFTPEITVVTPAVPANTDWWENGFFVNTDSKQAGAKLSDWVAVDGSSETVTIDEKEVIVDADGTHGTILKPTGTLGAFCFKDTKNVLPQYEFDISFDLFMKAYPSSNINLLKFYTNGSTAFNTLQIWDGGLFVMDNGNRESSSIVKLALGEWHNIRVRMNFVKGTMLVYHNDILIREADLFALNEGYDFENINQMQIEIHSHYSNTVKAYHYLDNIRVQTVDVATPAFDGAKLIGVQQSTSSNSIRVLAGVDSLNYSNVGFVFELLADDGTGWRQVHDASTDLVYTEITADGETVKASEEGCNYFTMAIITDIDSDGILCVRPYTTKDGVRNYGEEAIYSLKVDDGSLLMQSTSIASAVGEYKIYKEEGFEEARETFSMYSATPSATDTNEYRLGGDMLNSNSVPVGATTAGARTGEKGMTITGIAPNAAGSYSARIKLNNLMPYDLSSYVKHNVRISAYVKMDDFKNSEETVALRLGLMSDNGYTELTYKTHQLTEGEWTWVEYEGAITEDFLSSLGEGYPARVFLGLGSVTNYASTIYVDDIKVEFKESVGITLPSIFADGMVLQRNKPVNVWGWDALEGDIITATVTDKSGTTVATASATADANGEFEVTLSAMTGASEQTLTVTNATTGGSIKYTDVGIGEVWYCSGQSNMQLAVSKVHNIEDIIADASNRDIRSFKMNISAKYTLQKDVSGGAWKQITTDNVSGISAIGYITAYQLQKELGVPVAIIESYNGGSAANPWLSYEKIFAEDRADVYNNEDWIPKNADGSLVLNSSGCEGRTVWEDYEYYWQVGTSSEGTLQTGTEGSIGNRFAPTGLYNGMQGPLAGYAIAGVMWYQGEARANSLKTEQYNYILNDLVEQWREDFRDEDLPVVIFQLAPYSDYYNLIRQVQLDTAKRTDHVYAITTAYEGAVYSAASGGYCLDLDRSMSNGWGNGIHPGTKRPVAERAAYAILVGEYGMTDKYAAYLNPEYQSMTVAGNVATLTFINADGLKIREGDTALTGFRAYGADGKELTVVSAVIDGSSVVITTEEGSSPAKITYAFDVSSTRREVSYDSLATNDGYNPQYINVMTGNLENGKGQPTIPFLAEVSNVSIYSVSATSGKLNVEIRELGHLCSSYKVVVDVNGTATEYTATFATAGNYVIDDITVSAGDSVTVTLKSADGATEMEKQGLTVQ